MRTLPAPRRFRRWTADKQAAFIAALADTASVTTAAERVGMTPQSAYWLRRLPEAADFRRAWEAALVLAWGRVETTALERAINGEVEEIERDGEVIIRRRPCAAQLMVHMVDRAVAAREKAEARAAAAAAEAARLRATSPARLARVRAERRAEAKGRVLPPPRPDECELPPFDPASDPLLRLGAMMQGFIDRPGPPDDGDAAADRMAELARAVGLDTVAQPAGDVMLENRWNP